jgi:hypothetical protein
VIGTWTGAVGRGAIVTVPSGDLERFMEKAVHSVSVSMSVSKPVGSTIVALREAQSSTPTFQRK